MNIQCEIFISSFLSSILYYHSCSILLSRTNVNVLYVRLFSAKQTRFTFLTTVSLFSDRSIILLELRIVIPSTTIIFAKQVRERILILKKLVWRWTPSGKWCATSSLPFSSSYSSTEHRDHPLSTRTTKWWVILLCYLVSSFKPLITLWRSKEVTNRLQSYNEILLEPSRRSWKKRELKRRRRIIIRLDRFLRFITSDL